MKTTVDLYFWINCFFTFSLIGYILECIVLTVENRKPVYNRGFGHGPFCIIYGFGAVGAAVLHGKALFCQYADGNNDGAYHGENNDSSVRSILVGLQ